MTRRLSSIRPDQPDSPPRPAAVEQKPLEEQLRQLWAMSPSQRVAAMRRGELNMRQCCAWAGRHADQVPLLNGEFEFIASYTPEASE